MTDASTRQDYARHHLRFGWWLLLVFASAGLALELLHGFKVRAYLDVSNETRRLMWTLAHAHGTLLGLVHIVFGLSLAAVPDFSRGWRSIAGIREWACWWFQRAPSCSLWLYVLRPAGSPQRPALRRNSLRRGPDSKTVDRHIREA